LEKGNGQGVPLFFSF